MWLQRVQGNMGLMQLSSVSAGVAVTPQPAQTGLTQIADTVNQAAAAAPATSQPPTDPNAANGAGQQPNSNPSANPSFDQSLKQKAQEGLLSVLDRVFQQLGNMINPAGNNGSGNGMNGSGGNGPGGPTVPVSLLLQKQDVIINPSGPRVGDQVALAVTVHNQSPNSDAANLVVAVVDDQSNALAQIAGGTVPRNGSQNFALQWSPSEAKSYQLSAVVADANLNVLTSVGLDPLTVAAANGSTNGNPIVPVGNAQFRQVLLPLGTPRGAGLSVTSAGRSVIVGQSQTVSLTLANPYNRPLNDVRATLLLDGRQIQSRELGYFLPGQSRSVLFTNAGVAQAGRHEAKVIVESREARSHKGFVATQFEVATAQSNFPATSLNQVQPQRSMLPARVKVGGVTVPLRTSTSTAIATNTNSNPPRISTIRPITTSTETKVSSGNPKTLSTTENNSAGRIVTPPRIQPAPQPDLSIATRDIVYRPEMPRVGAPLGLAAAIHNNGKGDAHQARIVCLLFADGRQIDAREFRADIKASEVYVVKWSVATPAARRLRVEVSVSVGTDTDSNNNHAALDINLPVSNPPPGPVRTVPRVPVKPR